MQVDIRDTIMNIMDIKSSNIRDYFKKYRIERKFIGLIGDDNIDNIDDSFIYKCTELSTSSKDYISIKLNLLKVLLQNMDRTERIWSIYANNIDQKNLELKAMIQDIVSEVKVSKANHKNKLIINKELEDMSVYSLSVLDIPNSYIRYAENNKIATFRDIASDVNFIENYSDASTIKLLSLNLEDFIESIIMRDVRSYEIITLYNSGCKLESIGNQFGITRERVRQIVSKIRYKITDLFIDGTSEEELVDLDNYKEIIQKSLLDTNKISLFNLFTSNDALKAKLSLLEEAVLANLDKTIWIDELMSLIENDIERLDLSNYISGGIIFKKLKNSGNFTISEQAIVSNDKLTGSISDIRTEVIKRLYPNGVYISQENIDNILNITNEITGRNKDNSSFFLKNSIVKVCVLRDKNTYIHPDLIDVPDSLIEELKKYVLDRPGIELFYGTIFRTFEDKLRNYDIDNEYYLHGILDKYLSDIIEVKARSYHVKGHKAKKILDLLEELSYNEKRIVSLEEFNKFIDKDCYRSLINKANSINDLLNYDNNNFYSYRNVVITDEDRVRLDKIINESMLYNQLDCDDLFEKIKDDDILIKNKVYNSRALKSLIRRIFLNEFDGIPASNVISRIEKE